MEIKVGQYYALESTEEGRTEVNIIKILPNKPNTLDVFVCTETLYVTDGEVCDLYTTTALLFLIKIQNSQVYRMILDRPFFLLCF